AQEVPNYHIIIVLVNHPAHGGSGAAGLSVISSGSTPFEETVLHELGHSAFGLADEYSYYLGDALDKGVRNTPPNSEPAFPNVTLNSTIATLPWRDLTNTTLIPTNTNPNCTLSDTAAVSPVPKGTIGAFVGGNGYHCDIFRAEFDCKMRTLTEPFCAVC